MNNSEDDKTFTETYGTTKVYFQPHFKTGETMSASEAHHTTKRSLEYMNSWSEPSDLANLRLGASQGKTSNNKYF
jgi:hypothetical protein